MLIEAEEDPAFVKDERFRCVKVFRFALTEDPSAKAHHPAGEVKNGAEDSVPESVVEAAPLLSDQQACLFCLGKGKR